MPLAAHQVSAVDDTMIVQTPL